MLYHIRTVDLFIAHNPPPWWDAASHLCVWCEEPIYTPCSCAKRHEQKEKKNRKKLLPAGKEKKLRFSASTTFNSSHCRHDGPEQAATFILDVGMIVTMLGENVSVAFRASVANAGAAALAAEKPRNIKRSQQNFQMDFVLMASLYAKLKGG